LQRWVIAAGPATRVDRCGELLSFPLEESAAERDRLTAWLSAEERTRAARFHAGQHQRRFTVAHGRLRQILAEVLGVEPQHLQFAVGPYGKPQLTGDWERSGLQFNLSHSADRALLAWSWRRAVGVDIELWRPLHDAAALVRRYFSASEIAAWDALPSEVREQGFFDCWTRKEAYIKAVGRGLGLPLDSFDVSLGRGSEARLQRASQVMDDGRPWSLTAIDAGPRASAALVVEGESCHVVRAT
jgi:4'-phosphopantetheinyl transferase